VRVYGASKQHALAKSRLPCIGAVETLNLTRGCAGNCLFCYSRCQAGAPPSETLLIYDELAEQLRRELEARRRDPPPFVILGSAGDVCLGGERSLAVTHACIDVLLKRGIGVSFSTRGTIPRAIVELLSQHSQSVQVTIPLASVSESYTSTWEPGTALPKQRLFLLQQLQEVGITPHVRIEPIIPFVNDDTEQLRRLVSALVSEGIKSAMVSFLELRRGVADQIRREAPYEVLRLVLASFPSLQDTGVPADFDHVAPQQALAGLRRILNIGREAGLRIAACLCHNPGLPATQCEVAPHKSRKDLESQQEMFRGDPHQ